MPLIANNIIVGGESAPTPKKEIAGDGSQRSFQDIVSEAYRKHNKANRILQNAANIESQRIKPVTPPPEPKKHYVTKEDGELIRHLNKKSDYIRDIYEIE